MSEKTEIQTTCPHCQAQMLKWQVPPDSTWTNEFFWVCFNDECPYYVNGWKLMSEKYQQNASYRHSLNPDNGATSPIPVWSAAALKSGIISEEG